MRRNALLRSRRGCGFVASPQRLRVQQVSYLALTAVNSRLLSPRHVSLSRRSLHALRTARIRIFATTTLASARGKGTTKGKNITWREAEGTWVRKILNLCTLPFYGREKWRPIEPQSSKRMLTIYLIL